MSINISEKPINISENTIAALIGAEGESNANPFATISDVAGGGAGAALLLTGGTMTGDITFGTAGQYIGEGNFDTSRGGVNGLSLVCSVGYELNWQAGWLTTTEQNSTTPRPLYLDSVAGTTLRSWDYSGNAGTEVSHTGITFPDNTTQTTAYTGGGGGGTPSAIYLLGFNGTYTAAVGDRIFIVDGTAVVDVSALIYSEPAGTELTFINQDATASTYALTASSGFYVGGSGGSTLSLPAKVTKKAILGTDTYFYVI